MRNPRPAIFPDVIYSLTHPRMTARYRRGPAYSEAYPSISSIAREFSGGKIGVYHLVRIAKVERTAEIQVGKKKAKVRGHFDGLDC
jgi:hypothetical protein